MVDGADSDRYYSKYERHDHRKLYQRAGGAMIFPDLRIFALYKLAVFKCAE